MYLPDTNAPTVVKHTKSCFAKFGIPKTVFSDNGPQFTSNEYKLFSKQWDFVHDTSSPEFAQSNGFVERMIQTLKKSLDKTFASDQDPYLALLTLRTTPDEEGISPAYRLKNSQPRTVSPSLCLQQQNQSNFPVQISQKAIDRYNSTASHLPELHPGDTVRLRKNKKWERKGRVISKSEKPRSYHVETEKGKFVRRNTVEDI